MMKAFSVTSLVLVFIATCCDATTPTVAGVGNDVTFATSSSSMPPGWEGMCEVTKQTAGSKTIQCHVTKDSKWEIDTFRNWSQGLGPGHVIDLNVTCSREGAIVLPWPYRAHNLRSLFVRNCILLRWLEESSRPEFLRTIEDKLEFLQMENNVAQIRLMLLIQVMKNASEEFDCGPRRLRSYVQTGATYSFVLDENLSEHEAMMLMTMYLQANASSKFTCRYEQLETYEETHRASSGTYSVYLLTRNAEMPSLRKVNLSHSQLSVIPKLFFVWHDKFPQLQTLNLSYNLISDFNLEVFDYMTEGQIDLTHNHITTLGKQEMDSLSRIGLVKVDIRHNPFVCECSTADFSDFLHDHDGPGEVKLDPYYSYLWDLTCESPVDRKRRRISEFSKEQLCNDHADGKIFVLFILLPLAAVMVVLYLHFQLEVNVFFYTHLGWLGRCGRKGGGLGTMEYDLYVSHGQHDRDVQFVLKELRPRLEVKDAKGNQKYKLCLECRDFEVGAHIAENILTKMAGSRAVVMLLSGDMRVDGWAEFEFQEALFRAVSERRRLLVFLQRGALDTKLLSSALRRALNLFPIIKVGERQFWDKLDYFLQTHAACPGNTGRTCCPCRFFKQDTEKELLEVTQLAQADLERSRQKAFRANPPPALDPALMV